MSPCHGCSTPVYRIVHVDAASWLVEANMHTDIASSLGFFRTTTGPTWTHSIERIAVLARDRAEPVDELTVQDESQVVEECASNSLQRGAHFLVRGAGTGFGQRLVGRELLTDHSLGVIEFILVVTFTAEHGLPFMVL